MAHSHQIADHLANERHAPVADFDWDTYYWAPVPSKHIPFPLPHSLSGRIPFEILYDVFKNLAYEVDRLSITIVCKDWYQWFRDIPYSDLCIRDRKGLHSLLAQYARCERVRRRFRSTTTLRIHQRDGSSESFCDPVPLVLGTRMPAVRTLVFCGCIRPSMHPTFAKGLRLFESIRCLELSTFILGSLGELYRMLIGCPLLEALILRNGRYRSPYPAQTAAPSRTPSQNVHLPKLRRLELRHLETSLFVSLVDWLSRTACSKDITHLAISEFAGVGAQLSTRLLQAIGPSLEQLCLVDIPMRPYLHADDDAPNLGLNSNIMQVDAEIKAADCESIKSLTSLMMPPDSDGDADYRMHFMRSWWLIIRTVPYPARQRIHLNFIRMGWDLFARAHSEPIKTIMHEEDIDLVRLRFWDGAPVGGHNPGASRRICCFEVYRRFADGRVVQSQCGKEIRGDDAYWVTRVFELHMASHHLPQIRQEPQGTHFVSVTNCRWLYPDGMICDQMIKVHSDARRPCYALAQHVGKKTDHFALHLARCQREDCGCNKDFPSYDALARHHRRLDERLNSS